MGPHPEVPLDVQKYIGSCLITQQQSRSKRKTVACHQGDGCSVGGVYGSGSPTALSAAAGTCRAVDVSAIGCCYPNLKNYAWTGLPLISIASSRQKVRGTTSKPRAAQAINVGKVIERERKDSSGSECPSSGAVNLEDILPISRLAIHAQGAPLIISAGECEKLDGNNNRCCGECQFDSCVDRRHGNGGGYWSSGSRSASGSSCSSPMSIVLPASACYSQEEESNLYGDLVRQMSPLPSDSVSTTSEDSITSENGLPRIIKPRKRRKKDRRTNFECCDNIHANHRNAGDFVGGKAIVTLKPYQPLCYGFGDSGRTQQQTIRSSEQSGKVNCDDVGRPAAVNGPVVSTNSVYPYPSSTLCRCPYCVPPPPTVITPPDSPIGLSQEKWNLSDQRESSCEISTKVVGPPGGVRDLEIKFLRSSSDKNLANGEDSCTHANKGMLVLTSSHPPQRPWVQLTEPSMSSSCTFTVMCYNILCDKYATRQMYGYCPNWALEWNYRKKNIMHEIRHYKADVISLQEVETEQFYHYFLPELKKDGYDGIFSPKSRAKTMSESERKHVDGCAIFFKTNKFFLIKEYLVEFNQLAMANAEGSDDMLNRVMTKDNIGLAALLQTRIGAYDSGVDPSKANQTILVCTAHIHWDPEYSDVKLIQTMMLMHELQLIVEDTLEKCSNPNVHKNDLNTIPLLLCGDFNSLPNSGVIEFLSTGHISTNHCDFKQFVYEDCLRKLGTSLKANEFTHPFKICRAYNNDIMPFTNYSYDFKGIIDYVFYSELHMTVLGVLGPVDSSWLHENRVQGCPHPHVPSDHFPILVELELASTLPIHPPPPNGVTLHR